ncbi:hypothetical protein H4219_002184 [Mycoemilia scoparia]|uniref:Phospholipid scramblase n=1 Tax=Mycoemilia scoparia TaxID=417184 RepID=A0A9W8DQX9_9FUNG|nr:hypothetical protein H4219_002184 [Mycoemilia scoparia]
MRIFDHNNTLIGESFQEWHPWRRRYNLFRQKDQFARIDAQFLSWEFDLKDDDGSTIGAVSRNFMGFGRELFTDMGHYALYMNGSDVERLRDPFSFEQSQNEQIKTFSGDNQIYHIPEATKNASSLSLDERAVMLGCAMSIDFDYFSRHSHHGSGSDMMQGIDQANQYELFDENKEKIGNMFENKEAVSSIVRHTADLHRPLEIQVTDNYNNLLLKMTRPFKKLHTHLTVSDASGNVIGKASQKFHVFKGSYELTLGESETLMGTAKSYPIIKHRFKVTDQNDNLRAEIDRRLDGLAKELFTDTKMYAIYMDPSAGGSECSPEPLTLDEKAVLLACAVAIDYDHFSKDD